MVEATLEGDHVTRLLIEILVGFLMESGTVRCEDYFQFIQQTKKYLIENSNETSESKVKIIESIFWSSSWWFKGDKRIDMKSAE